MQIAWRKLFIAGVAGFACGRLYSLLRKYPEVVRPILQCSAASGAVGTLVGLGVSAYRNLPSHIYAVSVGANFAIASGVFLGLRHVILTSLHSKHTPLHPSISLHASQHTWGPRYLSSATSGGLTGAFASILSRHSVRSILLTCCGGVLFGVCGQLAFDQFELWRKRKAIELHYPELVQKADIVEWSLEAFQRHFLGFWHRYSKSGEVAVRVVLLEEAIKEEKEKLAELDKQQEQTGDSQRTHPSPEHASGSVVDCNNTWEQR